jgi:spore maturation protein CgeB
MAAMGYCPSGRLFEAAACGAAIVSDTWPGISQFYQPGEEILIASDSDDVIAALALDDGALRRMGQRARERTLDEHSTNQRARELVAYLEAAPRSLIDRAFADGTGAHSEA